MKSSGKQWISLSLLSIMLVKVWVIPLLYLDFELRRDYIIANLCENRNRPQLNCNGKCYLAKKLAAAKEQEKRQAERNFLSKLIDSTSEQRNQFILLIPGQNFEIKTGVPFNYSSPYTARVAVDDIFHPPSIV